MPARLATNAAAQTGITTAFNAAQGIPLAATAAASGGDIDPMPASGYWAHLELDVDITAGAPTTLSAFLTWDSTGDSFASATATATLRAGLTTPATRRGTAIALDTWFRMPSSWAAGTVYLFLQTDAGTVTVPIGGARLVYADGPVHA